MKITVLIEGVKYDLKQPFEGADHAVLVDTPKCPRCRSAAPVKVAGSNKRPGGHDTYVADGKLLCCQANIGLITAKVSTIFGTEEDERIFSGRWRVY